jgi:hypothetical protein
VEGLELVGLLEQPTRRSIGKSNVASDVRRNFIFCLVLWMCSLVLGGPRPFIHKVERVGLNNHVYSKVSVDARVAKLA